MALWVAMRLTLKYLCWVHKVEATDVKKRMYYYCGDASRRKAWVRPAEYGASRRPANTLVVRLCTFPNFC